MDVARTIIKSFGGPKNIIGYHQNDPFITIQYKEDTCIDFPTLNKCLDIKEIHFHEDFCDLTMGENLTQIYVDLEDCMASSFDLSFVLDLIDAVFKPLVPLLIIGGISLNIVALLNIIPFHGAYFQNVVALFDYLSLWVLQLFPLGLCLLLGKYCKVPILPVLLIGISLLSFNQLPSYDGLILPSLLSTMTFVVIYKILTNYEPFKNHSEITTWFSLMTSLVLIFTLIAPLSADVNTGINYALEWAFTKNAKYLTLPILGYFITYLYQWHMPYLLVPLDMMMIGQLHCTYLWPIYAISFMAQAGASYALSIKGDMEAKNVLHQSFWDGHATKLYDYNAQLKIPSRYAAFSAAIASLCTSLFILKAPSIGALGIASLLTFASLRDLLIYLGACLIAAIIPYYIITDMNDRQLLYDVIKSHLPKKKIKQLENNEKIILAKKPSEIEIIIEEVIEIEKQEEN